MEQFLVTNDTVGGMCCVSASGELDIATVSALESAFEAARAGAPQAIVIDLRAVTFIDSTGMALLLRLLDVTGAPPLRFRISPAIERLLEIIGLEGRLPLEAAGEQPG